MSDTLSDWISVTRPWGAELKLAREVEGSAFERAAADAVAFVIVVEGRATLEVEGASMTLGAGEVVLLIQGPAHRLITAPLADGRATTLLVGLYEGSRCPVTSMWAGSADVVRIDAEATARVPAIQAIIPLLVAELEAPDDGGDPMVSGLLDALMVGIVRAAVRVSGEGSWLAGIDDAVLSPAIQAVHADPSGDWTLERLARVAGVSRSLFSQRFSDHMNETPMGYVRRWRMSLAARLLMDEALDLDDVARQVGYKSQYAFSRTFKRIVGEPPGQFRRQRAS